MKRILTFKSNFGTVFSITVEEENALKAIHRAYAYIFDMLTTDFSVSKDEVFNLVSMEIVSRGTIPVEEIEKVKKYEYSLLKIIEQWKKKNE